MTPLSQIRLRPDMAPPSQIILTPGMKPLSQIILTQGMTPLSQIILTADMTPLSQTILIPSQPMLFLCSNETGTNINVLSDFRMPLVTCNGRSKSILASFISVTTLKHWLPKAKGM